MSDLSGPAALPEIFCDFNARMTDCGYLLSCRGAIDDLAALGLTPESAVGLRFTFVEAHGPGEPDDLMGDGVVVLDPYFGPLALVDRLYERSDFCRG